MNKIVRIILPLVILNLSTAFGQFEVCNSGTDKTLHDVHFINENIGIAVGDAGIILRSTDGGLAWSQTMAVDTIDFRSVGFWDELNGIALATKDLYVTEDAGISWNRVLGMNQLYFAIELFGGGKAIIAGESGNMYEYSTSDHSLTQISQLADGVLFNHMSFVNDTVGYANFQHGAIVELYKTVDGGVNWVKVDQSSDNLITIVEDIKFVTENIGFRGGWYSPHLQKTMDGGRNWSQMELDTAQSQFWSSLYDFHILFDQPYTYYACGWYGDIFRSVDGGRIWKELESPVPSSTILRSIFFVDDFIGWVVGDNGTILRTTNGGGLVATDNIREEQLKVYPNPVVDYLIIEDIEKLNIDQIELFDQSGKLLRTFNPTNKLSMKSLETGNYILKIQCPSGVLVYNITKM